VDVVSEDRVVQLVLDAMKLDGALDDFRSGKKAQPCEHMHLDVGRVQSTLSVPRKVLPSLTSTKGRSIFRVEAGVKELHHRLDEHFALPLAILKSAGPHK
jgi:hypothetical protein